MFSWFKMTWLLMVMLMLLMAVIAPLAVADTVADTAALGTANPAIYQLGKAATPALIKGWDIDVRPDGMGLPVGSGSVADGEELYDQKCAACHGSFGEGEGRWPKLAGGSGTLQDERPEKTVGSYWPYVSTLWDYIHRAMPFNAPQSLNTTEVYAITAYVLNLNDLVDEDFVLTERNLAAIQMPNRHGFYVDNRPDVSNVRCMRDCKSPQSIKVTSSIVGITPTDHFKHDGNDGVAFTEFNTAVDVDPLVSQTYQNACKICHETGLNDAPKVGDAQQWQQRLQQGRAVVYQHALLGFKGMPAKGGNAQLSDELVKSVVDYMIAASE
ncbi:MAG: cytochrome c5 [Phenylobacterium sp.]|jgi:cytochrome c5